jgi:hypothetical protein
MRNMKFYSRRFKRMNLLHLQESRRQKGTTCFRNVGNGLPVIQQHHYSQEGNLQPHIR